MLRLCFIVFAITAVLASFWIEKQAEEIKECERATIDVFEQIIGLLHSPGYLCLHVARATGSSEMTEKEFEEVAGT
jgi:hypothetical protein